jgi:hypothetical protein
MVDGRTHEERQTDLMEQMVKELDSIKMAIYGVIVAWAILGFFVYVAIKEAGEAGL